MRIMARSYNQSCSVAHALDLVGERWALLVVRELLLGPKRFVDLRAGLPQASPNILSDRLRELGESGIARRRKLGPPAAVWVYELTEYGLELESILIQLTRWGARSPLRDVTAGASVDAIMLALRSRFDPGSTLTATYQLRIGEHAFALHIADGKIGIVRGEASEPDGGLEGDPMSLAAVLAEGRPLTDKVKLTGDAAMVKRLLDALG
jgi:DNA-binding HxlR family transcriptional regulator